MAGRRRAALFLSVAMVAVLLAGCTEQDVGPESLAAGQGAIAGLLVDDRFRPIHLVDGEPRTEFQAQGFVLLQETGEQVRTNENGEFTFADLMPGSYTLRIQAAGHEAVPQRVSVREGEFAEASVVARRIVSLSGSIITQDFAVFIPCSIFFIANGIVYDCTFDQSGDSYRAFYLANHSAIPDVSAMVTEMKANRVGNYAVQVRSFPPSGTEYYAVAVPEDVDYIRVLNEVGVPNEEWTDFGDNDPWNNTYEFQTIMFAMGMYHRQFADTGLVCCGVGVILGTKAQFLQSVFVGPPEVDLQTYCVLC